MFHNSRLRRSHNPRPRASVADSDRSPSAALLFAWVDASRSEACLRSIPGQGRSRLDRITQWAGEVVSNMISQGEVITAPQRSDRLIVCCSVGRWLAAFSKH